LLHAVADLQGRLFNILRKGFLEAFLKNGSEREKNYAVENTIYVFAQFLAWTELIRQDLRFVAHKDPEDTARLRRLQEVVNKTLTSDSINAPFMIFSGEQRALGEFMIHEVSGTRQVMGYGAFLSADKTTINQWLDPLRQELRNAAGNSKILQERLIPLQHTMIELMDLLDPDGVNFSKVERFKI
jgi:hypothetical protein